MEIRFVNPSDASKEKHGSTSLAYFRCRVTEITPNVHLVKEVQALGMEPAQTKTWIEYLDPEVESNKDLVRRALRSAWRLPETQINPITGSAYRGFASEDLDDER